MGNKSSRSSRLNNTRGAVNVPNRQDVKDAIFELPGTKVCVCVYACAFMLLPQLLVPCLVCFLHYGMDKGRSNGNFF